MVDGRRRRRLRLTTVANPARARIRQTVEATDSHWERITPPTSSSYGRYRIGRKAVAAARQPELRSCPASSRASNILKASKLPIRICARQQISSLSAPPSSHSAWRFPRRSGTGLYARILDFLSPTPTTHATRPLGATLQYPATSLRLLCYFSLTHLSNARCPLTGLSYQAPLHSIPASDQQGENGKTSEAFRYPAAISVPTVTHATRPGARYVQHETSRKRNEVQSSSLLHVQDIAPPIWQVGVWSSRLIGGLRSPNAEAEAAVEAGAHFRPIPWLASRPGHPASRLHARSPLNQSRR